MKLFNIFPCLVFFSFNIFCSEQEQLKPKLFGLVPQEIWLNIAEKMGKEGYKLLVSGKAALNFEEQTFQRALKIWESPFIKAIAEKQADRDLRDFVFKLPLFGDISPVFIPFEVFDKKEGVL